MGSRTVGIHLDQLRRSQYDEKSLAERFYDEGESNHSYTYAKTGRAVLSQPGGIAYQIYDQKGINLFRLGAEYTDVYEEAESITELATKIGLDPIALETTVIGFNQSCSTEISFSSGMLDGRSTKGLNIPKSNWANRIDTPPVRVYAGTGGISFSFGGVSINTKSEVLDITENAIPGLYASDDIVACFFIIIPPVQDRRVMPCLVVRQVGMRLSIQIHKLLERF